MSVKILGGKGRGFTLATPKSELTRPTSVLVRRKIFDWRQNLEGHHFIDLCAGSGAMGLEALSRGADQVYLNDLQRAAFLTLKKNVESFSKAFSIPSERIQTSGLDAVKWIEKEMDYQLQETENAILFMDPPYEDHKLYLQILRVLKEKNFKGEVWLEGDRLVGPKIEELTGAFSSVIKKVEQGDHFVLIGFLV